MNTNEILAQHGLVIVQANDVRKMMDYYQLADRKLKTPENDEQYERLWNALNEVGLAYGYQGHEPDNERGVWCCEEHRQAFLDKHPNLKGK